MSVLGPMLASRLKEDPNCFLQVVGEFIQNNVTIVSYFTGSNGVTTVAQVPSVNLIDASILLGMSITGQNGFISWCQDIYSIIKTNCFIKEPLGIGVIPSLPISAFSDLDLTLPSWTQEDLKSVHTNNLNDPQGAVMEVIGSGIERDLKSRFTKIPWGGTYQGVYVGESLISQISIF